MRPAHERDRAPSEGGFTLIEIMVSIVLVGLLATSAVVGFSAVRRGRLRAGAGLLSSALRFGYVHALTTGRTTRVALSMGGDSVWIEDTDDAHVLDPHDPLRAGGAAADVEAEARRQAERILNARPRAPRAEFSRPRGNRFRVRRMRDVVVARLYTPHDAEPREEGTGYVYFFAGGIGERAVVHLRGADGETYSVSLEPLTARAEIFDRPIEPPPEPEEGGQNDQSEVDTRERRPE